MATSAVIVFIYSPYDTDENVISFLLMSSELCDNVLKSLNSIQRLGGGVRVGTEGLDVSREDYDENEIWAQKIDQFTDLVGWVKTEQEDYYLFVPTQDSAVQILFEIDMPVSRIVSYEW